jgi:hypothetical protein
MGFYTNYIYVYVSRSNWSNMHRFYGYEIVLYISYRQILGVIVL